MSLTPTAQRWARLVTALEQSDLTAKAFAAKHNVNPSTLSWWWSRFRGSIPSRGFVEVELPAVLAAPPEHQLERGQVALEREAAVQAQPRVVVEEGVEPRAPVCAPLLR